MFKGFQNTGPFRIITRSKLGFEGFQTNPNTVTSSHGDGIYVQPDAMQAWWKSDSGLTTSGSSATTWLDSVGGFTLTFGTNTYLAQDPLFNNYPSITLTAAGTNAGDVLDIRTNTGWTVMAVVKAGNSKVNSRGIIGKGGSSLTTAGEYLVKADGSANFYDSSAVATNSNFSLQSNAYGNIDVYTGTWDFINGFVSIFINDSTARQASISTTPTDWDNAFNFGIGTPNTSATTYVECLVWNVTLTAVEIAQMCQLFANKYKIPVALKPQSTIY